jgi:hypothetical protein
VKRQVVILRIDVKTLCLENRKLLSPPQFGSPSPQAASSHRIGKRDCLHKGIILGALIIVPYLTRFTRFVS